ncbi:lipoprotein [Spiroplasma endosymbiont of Cantharis nigra]|uniref:lipoprotein n=1 Tax=Spiroplasma endosymbiont of Cantharis nigra TaxID=3066278 RepID=UPI0030D27799
MKKLLGLLGAAGLVATTSATVVACGKEDDGEKIESLEFSNLESKKITINLGKKTDKAVVKSVSNVKESILTVTFGEVGDNGDVVVTITPSKLPKDKDVKETITITYGVEVEGKQNVLSTKKINVTVKKDTSVEVKEVLTNEVQSILDATVKEKEFSTKQEAVNVVKAAQLGEGLQLDGEPTTKGDTDDVTVNVVVKAKDGYKIKDGEETKFSVIAKVTGVIKEVSTSGVKAALEATTSGKEFETKQEAIDAVKAVKLAEGLQIDGEPTSEGETENITINVVVKAKEGYKIKDGEETEFSVNAKIKIPLKEVSTSGVKAALDATTSGKEFDNKQQAIEAVKAVKLAEGLELVGDPTTKGETEDITIDVVVKAKEGYKIKDGEETEFSVNAKIKIPLKEVSTSGVQSALEATTSGKEFDNKQKAIEAVKNAQLVEGLEVVGDPTTKGETEDITIDVVVKAKEGYKIKDGEETEFSVNAKIKIPLKEVSTSGVQSALEATTSGKEFDNKQKAIEAVKNAQLVEGLEVVGDPTTKGETEDITIDVVVKAKEGYKIKDGEETEFSVNAKIKIPLKEVSTSGVQSALEATTSGKEFDNKQKAIEAVKNAQLVEGLEFDGEPTSEGETENITINVVVKATEGYAIKTGEETEFSVSAKIKIPLKEVSTSGVQSALELATSGKEFDNKQQAIEAVKNAQLVEGLELVGEPTSEGETEDITIKVVVKAKDGYVIMTGEETTFSVAAKIKSA